MGDAAAVADDEQVFVAGLEIFVQGHLHVIKLHLHAVEQGVVVGGAGGDLVQGVNHLDDAVQNPLGHHQAQIPRRGRQGGGDEALGKPLLRAALAANQVAEPLDDDAAAQHIAEPGDALAVAVGVLEGLGEVLGHQQGEVGVVGVEGGVLIAVAVDGDDAVGVLVHHHAVGIHAERAHPVLVRLGAVHDLALIQLVGEVGEHLVGQLHPDADVHPVGLGLDVQVAAHALHPLAAAAAHGDDAGPALEGPGLGGDAVAALHLLHRVHRGVEIQFHALFQLAVEIFQHHVVDVGAQVADGGVQQVEVVLQAQLFHLGVAGGVQLCALAAVFHVDFVHVFHQFQGRRLADVLMEGAAELVGDVILAVGEGAGAAEAVHNGAGGALDAALHLHAVDGAVAAGEGMARLKEGDFQLGPLFQQLVGGVDAAGAAADDQHVVCHRMYLLWFSQADSLYLLMKAKTSPFLLMAGITRLPLAGAGREW